MSEIFCEFKGCVHNDNELGKCATVPKIYLTISTWVCDLATVKRENNEHIKTN